MVTHQTDHSTELETTFGDPGLPMHVYRHSDIDPKAAKRREREVAALFGLSTLGTLLFIVAFLLVELLGIEDKLRLVFRHPEIGIEQFRRDRQFEFRVGRGHAGLDLRLLLLLALDRAH